MNNRLLPILTMWFCALACTAQSFDLKKQHDSLYYLNGWQLPYPVYQYQTGDVDGDGRTDAIVGVIKSTRFIPKKHDAFLFSRVSTARHDHCGWALSWADCLRISALWMVAYVPSSRLATGDTWWPTTAGADSAWPSTTIL